MTDPLKSGFELAALFVSVAVLTLLIGQADKTSKVIQSATSGFNSLLRTVTLQNSLGAGGFGSISG